MCECVGVGVGVGGMASGNGDDDNTDTAIGTDDNHAAKCNQEIEKVNGELTHIILLTIWFGVAKAKNRERDEWLENESACIASMFMH